jgi:hypothetical protein
MAGAESTRRSLAGVVLSASRERRRLACHECLLGDMTAAMARLRRARKLGGKQLKAFAMDDADFTAMRDGIAAMA